MDRFQETYYGLGQRAVLIALVQRCLLEFRVRGEAGEPMAAVNCEVLVQPTSERGLPDGQAIVLWRNVVAVRPLPGGTEYTGHAVLPREITPKLAGRCYLQLVLF